MKTFSQNHRVRALVLLLPLVVAVLWIETHLSHLPNTYQIKDELIHRKRDGLEVVVLGSSVEGFGISPRVFARPAFNLAHVAQSYDLSILWLEKHLSELTRLKMVLLPASYIDFELVLSTSFRKALGFYYSRFLGLSSGASWRQWLDLQNYSLFFLYGPDVSITYLNDGILPPLEQDIDEWGTLYAGAQEETPWSEIAARKALTYYDGEMRPEGAEINCKALDRLLQELSQRGVAVAFQSGAVSPAFYRHRDTGRVQRNQANLARFRDRFHVPFFDYSQDRRFVEADFRDPLHLSAKGAIKYSRILSSEVIEPIIRMKQKQLARGLAESAGG